MSLIPPSMTRVYNELPSIHPLLAWYARTLTASCGETAEGLLEKLAGKLARLASQANDQMDQTGKPSWFLPLRSHVLAAAGFAEEAGVQDASNLLGNLGYYLHRVADYRGAKAAYERALKIAVASYGPDHPAVAIRVNNLGFVLQAPGDLPGARAAYERALKIFSRFLPAGHPNIKIVRENLESLSDQEHMV